MNQTHFHATDYFVLNKLSTFDEDKFQICDLTGATLGVFVRQRYRLRRTLGWLLGFTAFALCLGVGRFVPAHELKFIVAAPVLLFAMPGVMSKARHGHLYDDESCIGAVATVTEVAMGPLDQHKYVYSGEGQVTATLAFTNTNSGGYNWTVRNLQGQPWLLASVQRGFVFSMTVMPSRANIGVSHTLGEKKYVLDLRGDHLRSIDRRLALCLTALVHVRAGG
jgi:hypothetical protein